MYKFKRIIVEPNTINNLIDAWTSLNKRIKNLVETFIINASCISIFLCECYTPIIQQMRRLYLSYDMTSKNISPLDRWNVRSAPTFEYTVSITQHLFQNGLQSKTLIYIPHLI